MRLEQFCVFASDLANLQNISIYINIFIFYT